MIKLTNMAVQESLYEILNSDVNGISVVEHEGRPQIAITEGDDATWYYPYNTKEAANADLVELKKLMTK